MRNNIEGTSGLTFSARLAALQMPHAAREKALRALHDAELSVDAVAWLTKKIERLVARLFLKPVL